MPQTREQVARELGGEKKTLSLPCSFNSTPNIIAPPPMCCSIQYLQPDVGYRPISLFLALFAQFEFFPLFCFPTIPFRPAQPQCSSQPQHLSCAAHTLRGGESAHGAAAAASQRGGRAAAAQEPPQAAAAERQQRQASEAQPPSSTTPLTSPLLSLTSVVADSYPSSRAVILLASASAVAVPHCRAALRRIAFPPLIATHSHRAREGEEKDCQ